MAQKSCQFVRSATFSSHAKSHHEPIDWSVIYLLGVIMCACMFCGEKADRLAGDRRWKETLLLVKNGGRTVEDRIAALAQLTCREGEHEWEGEGRHRADKNVNWNVQVLTHTVKGKEWKNLYVTEWKAKKENTVTLVYREKLRALGFKIFIKGNDAKWGNTSRGGTSPKVSKGGKGGSLTK